MKTIVAIEFHYSKDILTDLQYDSIYHEHIFYFTIKTISNLFKKYGLNAFDVFKSPISGGSLVLLFSKNKIKKTKLLQKFEFDEKKIEYKFTTKMEKIWKKFCKSCNKI